MARCCFFTRLPATLVELVLHFLVWPLSSDIFGPVFWLFCFVYHPCPCFQEVDDWPAVARVSRKWTQAERSARRSRDTLDCTGWDGMTTVLPRLLSSFPRLMSLSCTWPAPTLDLVAGLANLRCLRLVSDLRSVFDDMQSVLDVHPLAGLGNLTELCVRTSSTLVNLGALAHLSRLWTLSMRCLCRWGRAGVSVVPDAAWLTKLPIGCWPHLRRLRLQGAGTFSLLDWQASPSLEQLDLRKMCVTGFGLPDVGSGGAPAAPGPPNWAREHLRSLRIRGCSFESSLGLEGVVWLTALEALEFTGLCSPGGHSVDTHRWLIHLLPWLRCLSAESHLALSGPKRVGLASFSKKPESPQLRHVHLRSYWDFDMVRSCDPQWFSCLESLVVSLYQEEVLIPYTRVLDAAALTIQTLHIDGVGAATADVLFGSVHQFPQLTACAIALWSDDWNGTEILANLVGRAPYIRRLDLTGYYQVTDDDVQLLGGLGALEHLSCLTMDKVTDAGLCCIATHNGGLQSLNLRSLGAVTSKGVAHLQRLRHLRELKLDWALDAPPFHTVQDWTSLFNGWPPEIARQLWVTLHGASPRLLGRYLSMSNAKLAESKV